nr:MAG TPA: hypothetical protein [Ackermannviridae sp.]
MLTKKTFLLPLLRGRYNLHRRLFSAVSRRET